jgi:hypothetical protein
MSAFGVANSIGGADIPASMAFLGDEPEHELIVERVPGGRRAALIAGVVAVLIVGMLVWKPWDTVAPAAAPSLPAVVARAPTVAPSTSPAPTASAPAPVVVAPAPQIAQQPQTFQAPGNLGSVVFYANSDGTGGPGAWCIYKAGSRATRTSLVAIVVEPPVIRPGAALREGQLHSVSWHVELQSNTQDRIFYADWQRSARSAPSAIDLVRGDVGFVKPISVTVSAASTISVYRTSVVVEWLDRHGKPLARQDFLTPIYGTLGSEPTPAGSGGCAAVI